MVAEVARGLLEITSPSALSQLEVLPVLHGQESYAGETVMPFPAQGPPGVLGAESGSMTMMLQVHLRGFQAAPTLQGSFWSGCEMTAPSSMPAGHDTLFFKATNKRTSH